MTLSYSLCLISDQPRDLVLAQSKLCKNTVNLFNGSGYPSFSKLVNDCVEQASTETVIILCNRVIPTDADIDFILDKLDQGYAFVALFDFRFFGIRKQLFRDIGPLDERFSAGYEDDDFVLRMIQANMACFITQSAECIPGQSRWAINGWYPGQAHFVQKWVPYHRDGNLIEIYKRLPELDDKRDWGASKTLKYLGCKEYSYVTSWLYKYFHLERIGSIIF